MASDKELSDASVPYGLSDQGGETEPSDSENPRRQKKASSPSAGPSKVEPRKTKASVKFHDGPNDASVHENEKSDTLSGRIRWNSFRNESFSLLPKLCLDRYSVATK